MKRWLLQALVILPAISLQNVPSLKAQISARHRHLFLCPQHQQVLK